LGLALLYSGRSSEALTALKRAYEILPENGGINVNMAVWYFENNEYGEAWKHIKIARDDNAFISDEFIHTLSREMSEPR
jgi:Flp pilus assembly protein TadD